jgi:hypothetical protein
MIVVIEAGGTQAASAIDVSASYFATRSAHEVLNPKLRFGSLVDVIVTR